MTTTARVSALSANPPSIVVGGTTTFTATVKRPLGGPAQTVRVALSVPNGFALAPGKDHVDVSLAAGDTEKTGQQKDVAVTGAFNGDWVDIVVTATLNQRATCNLRLTK